MKNALSISMVLAIALAGCARAKQVDCRRDVPGSGTSRPATCPSGPVLCRDMESGERCVPVSATCWPDDTSVCETIPGIAVTTLEIICLEGDYDEAQVLATTPSCLELTMPPEEEDEGL